MPFINHEDFINTMHSCPLEEDISNRNLTDAHFEAAIAILRGPSTRRSANIVVGNPCQDMVPDEYWDYWNRSGRIKKPEEFRGEREINVWE